MQGEYPIQQLCQALSVSRSSYYNWRNAKTYRINPASKSMEDQVVAVFKANKRRYGTRRIVAELRHQDVQTSRYRVRKALY